MPATSRSRKKENPTARIRIGIGGWTYEPWRGRFYPSDLPQKRELEYASRKLTSIEINSTFYGTQRATSFEKWHDETPEDFVFALKAPRFATYRRVLAEASESVERFLSSGVLALKDKLGPINWQFAPTKQFDAEDFDGFLRLLPPKIDGRMIRHAVEVRHESFRHREFIAIAREHGVAVVMAGDSDYPQIADVTAPFVYARIMGTVESDALGYSEQALAEWAKRAKQWAAGDEADDLQTVAPVPSSKDARRDVYLYVISGYKAHNPATAMALIERTGNAMD